MATTTIEYMTRHEIEKVCLDIITAVIEKAAGEIIEQIKQGLDVFPDPDRYGSPLKDETNIKRLGLSGGLQYCLWNELKIETVGQLCNAPIEQLMSLQGFGKAKLYELRFKLAQRGRLLSDNKGV